MAWPGLQAVRDRDACTPDGLRHRLLGGAGAEGQGRGRELLPALHGGPPEAGARGAAAPAVRALQPRRLPGHGHHRLRDRRAEHHALRPGGGVPLRGRARAHAAAGAAREDHEGPAGVRRAEAALRRHALLPLGRLLGVRAAGRAHVPGLPLLRHPAGQEPRAGPVLRRGRPSPLHALHDRHAGGLAGHRRRRHRQLQPPLGHLLHDLHLRVEPRPHEPRDRRRLREAPEHLRDGRRAAQPAGRLQGGPGEIPLKAGGDLCRLRPGRVRDHQLQGV
mmetsp:Transcript_82025/g.240799  ORF Transcript_82025/g.240799 Transcript_82025/m.240799 type:complete len:276 (-) Transcript_82025:839-1666(-)